MITIRDIMDSTVNSLSNKVDISIDERRFSTLTGKAEILLKNDSITMSNVNNGMIICDYGSIIKGPSHLADTPSNIRINGFWVLNDELLTTLPSTTYTPIPVLVYKDSPYIKMIRGFIQTLSA